MKLFRRIAAWLRPSVRRRRRTLEAAEEGAQIRERMETSRLSTIQGGENYQTAAATGANS